MEILGLRPILPADLLVRTIDDFDLLPSPLFADDLDLVPEPALAFDCESRIITGFWLSREFNWNFYLNCWCWCIHCDFPFVLKLSSKKLSIGYQPLSHLTRSEEHTS